MPKGIKLVTEGVDIQAQAGWPWRPCVFYPMYKHTKVENAHILIIQLQEWPIHHREHPVSMLLSSIIFAGAQLARLGLNLGKSLSEPFHQMEIWFKKIIFETSCIRTNHSLLFSSSLSKKWLVKYHHYFSSFVLWIFQVQVFLATWASDLKWKSSGLGSEVSCCWPVSNMRSAQFKK